MSERTELMRRAWRAYLRAEGAAAEQPIEQRSGACVCDGLQYVVLNGRRGILAVFRVRTNGMLKRLRCWPLELGRPQQSKRGPSVVGEADRVELGAA